MNNDIGEEVRIRHWRCAEHNGCDTVGQRDDFLYPMVAEVLGFETFDEATVEKELDHITVESADRLVLHLSDGRTIEREWVKPDIPKKPLTEEQRKRQPEGIRRSFTPERRQAMNDRMKEIRKRGKEWRRKRDYMINGYITVKDVAEKWGLAVRTVQILCSEGKIEEAMKFEDVWAIPENAEKPTDGRVTTGEYKNWQKNIQKRFRMTRCVLLE